MHNSWMLGPCEATNIFIPPYRMSLFHHATSFVSSKQRVGVPPTSFKCPSSLPWNTHQGYARIHAPFASVINNALIINWYSYLLRYLTSSANVTVQWYSPTPFIKTWSIHMYIYTYCIYDSLIQHTVPTVVHIWLRRPQFSSTSATRFRHFSIIDSNLFFRNMFPRYWY